MSEGEQKEQATSGEKLPFELHISPTLCHQYDVVLQLEQQEWQEIVAQPHIQDGLRRLAAEAREQYYARKTVTGGFGNE